MLRLVTLIPRSSVLLLRFGLALPIGAANAQPAAENIADTKLDCVIEPQETVKLSSPVSGVIDRLDVDRGDIIHSGQIVGKLEDSVETSALELAKAKASNNYTIAALETKLVFQRRKFERLSKLSANMFSSVTALEDAESDYLVTEQQLSEAKLNRDMAQLEVVHAQDLVNQRTLRSPIDGVVVERLLLPGEYRNEQSPVLTLAQLNPLRVEVFVPTAYYGQIKVGETATIYPEQPLGSTYAATVTVVDRVHDAASGTFGVRLALPNPDLALAAGIRCDVRFAQARLGEQAGDSTPAK